MTTDKTARKERPLARGLLDYFPDALAEVAHLSYKANQQHNPGEEMHWAREKSSDHADCLMRHLIERGKTDDDGMLHSVKAAWRALALLQLELEAKEEEAEDFGDRYFLSPLHPDIYWRWDGRKKEMSASTLATPSFISRSGFSDPDKLLHDVQEAIEVPAASISERLYMRYAAKNPELMTDGAD